MGPMPLANFAQMETATTSIVPTVTCFRVLTAEETERDDRICPAFARIRIMRQEAAKVSLGFRNDLLKRDGQLVINFIGEVAVG